MAIVVQSLQLLIILCVSYIFCLAFAQNESQFIYNGFSQANLYLDGSAEIHHNGLLQLTNTSNNQVGHAFYPLPFKFNTTPSGLTPSLSFSTNFVFAMIPLVPNVTGPGMAFAITPSSRDFTNASAHQLLGLFQFFK
jgi:hypothetical protein